MNISNSTAKYVRSSNLLMIMRRFPELVRNWTKSLPTYADERKTTCNRDLAGKLPFAHRMLQLGLEENVLLDPALSGGVIRYERASPDGLVVWSDEDLKRYLKSGKGRTLEIKSAIRSDAAEYKGRYKVTFIKEHLQRMSETDMHVFVLLRNENPHLGHGEYWSDLTSTYFNENIEVGYCHISKLYELLRRHFARRKSPKRKSKKNPEGKQVVTPWTVTFIEYFENVKPSTFQYKVTKAFKWRMLGRIDKEWLTKIKLLPDPDEAAESEAAQSEAAENEKRKRKRKRKRASMRLRFFDKKQRRWVTRKRGRAEISVERNVF